MASPRVRFTRRGRRDLVAIVNRSVEEWGAERAARYRRALEATCDRLAEYPELGTLLSSDDTIRSFPSERHRIVYRETSGGIYVLRIIHQRMDVSSVVLS